MKICFIIDDEKIFHPNFVFKTFSLLNKKYSIEIWNQKKACSNKEYNIEVGNQEIA